MTNPTAKHMADAEQNKWKTGFAHWGQADVHFLCDKDHPDRIGTINGHPYVQVADYMPPKDAERIVRFHHEALATAAREAREQALDDAANLFDRQCDYIRRNAIRALKQQSGE